ncbi:DUF2336 domain-containing protein [Sphingomonas sp.]|uniref:DUF2336 domain-containing protein n=1 Tax=Sphingomonas sp. TaxID=28214 RepID=UPI00286BB7B4|nr:DUF2336 domain-containing protein [Sphingomonas sp.]
MATIRRDFFLDPTERLTEQERALMTAMLRDLVATLAASISAAIGGKSADPDPARIAVLLNSAGLLDRPQLIRLMLRRADEQRILSAFAGHAGPRRLPLLASLVSDSDPAVAAAAMALVVARGRRRDGFGQPRVDLSDLDRRDARALAHSVAAALSPLAASDGQYADAATRTFDAINRDESLDRAVETLIDALDATGRADEGLVEAASGEGEVALVAQFIARRARINQPAVWDHLVNAGEGGLALVARMAGFGRRAAARLIADLGSTSGAGSIEDEIARYDALGADEVAAALMHWQLASDYRAARNAIGGRNG